MASGAPASMDNGMSDNTFLTGLRGDGQPEYMKKVKDLHGQLRHAVANLSDKVGTLLKEREKDFLAAYRHHMYNVQKELQKAQQQVEEAKLKLRNNDQIVKLTKERDWFRHEAIRLDNAAELMRRDLEVMQQKVNSIDDDRAWLEKQLKNSKKQIKILRAELEANARATTTFGGGGSDFFGGDSQGMGHSRGSILPPAKSPAFGATPGRSSSHMGFRSPNRRITPRDDGFDDGQEDDRERRYKEQLRHLKQQLKTERRMTRELRAASVNDQSNRGELEEFFLRCIEEVKRSVQRRRAKTAVRNQKSRNSRDRLDDSGPPPSLKDFTATDRKEVIEKLLARDDVLSFIYDNLFPPAPEQGRARTAHASTSGPRSSSGGSRRSLR